jgi:DNA-binding transcriptional LysR family regulator
MPQITQTSRRIKLRQLEVLIAVAQAGNMAKAASQLAITQPVISKTIADLESTVGMRLFDRNRRGVELTLYGRALFDRSVAIFNDLKTAVAELETLSDPTAGELRIGSSDAVAAGMLTVIIDRLSRQYPRLRFEVTLGGGLIDLQYRELQARSLDLVIGRLPSAIPESVDVTFLYQDPSFVVAGAKSEWVRRRRKIDLADLTGESWCLPSLENYPWSLIADAFKDRGSEPPRSIVTTRSVQLLTGLVETGQFLTILPRTVLNFRPTGSQLKIVPVKLGMRTYPIGIATLKDRTLKPAVQLFVACAQQVIKAHTRAAG